MDGHTWVPGTPQARGLRPLRSELASTFDALEALICEEPMPASEIAERIAICARILDAWPNARPMNRDRTLLEYVNALRGVPLERLERCVQLAIDAGGDFMPPAGEVLKRAASGALGGPPVGTDRDEHFWHAKRVADTVRTYQRRAEQVLPINPDAPPLPPTSGPALPAEADAELPF